MRGTRRLAYYHGTSLPNAMSVMQEGFSTDTPESNGRTWGPGVYLGNTDAMARGYGDHVVEAEVDDWVHDFLAREPQQEHYAGDPRATQPSPWGDPPMELEEVLKREGFEGVQHRTGEGRDLETVVFDPKRVKPVAIQGPSFT